MTAIEKLLFEAAGESDDDSSETQNHTSNVAPVLKIGIGRTSDVDMHAESNDGSSLPGAAPNNFTNVGRP